MQIRDKNIFITGGSGFIGSWLCSKLVENNKVIIYDNERRNALKLSGLRQHKNLTYVRGDILDKNLLKRSIPRKLDIIFHLAAIAGVSSYYNIPLKTMEVNILGTYNLLEAIKDKDLELFLDFSTSEVYGRTAKHATERNDTSQGEISDMRWTYSISKLAAEKLCHCYYAEYGIPVVSIRPFNIYGSMQVGEGAIQIFISKALKNEDIYIDGNGSQIRAWCYIEDFIEGVSKCIEKKKHAIGNVFNIGNPEAAVTVLELAENIIQLSGSNSKVIFRRPNRTDIEYRIPDISKAKNILGFSPEVGLNKGLERTIKWYRKNLI